MKKIITFTVLIILIFASYFYLQNKNKNSESVNEQELATKFEKQGVQIEILQPGSGEQARNQDIVTVHYTGWLEDGTKFDSSVDRNVPFSFALGIGRVIQGWDIGVLGMKIGEKRKLTIPSKLGYGTASVGLIPVNSTLIFEVELLSIQKY